MKTVKLHTKARVDGCICKAGEVVSLPDFRAERMIEAGQCVPSTDTPRDTVRMTWIRPTLAWNDEKGVRHTVELKVNGEMHEGPVQVPGWRAERLIKNGKAALCDAPAKPVAKPKKGKGKKDESTGAGKED